MDPSSPTKRRALAPLDANVNAMSPTKMHKHTKIPGSPLKSPVKTPLGLKRPFTAHVFDENAVAKKKQCQEPVAAAPVSISVSATAPAPAPMHISAATTEAAAPASTSEDISASTSTSAPTPAAPAQTETVTEPDAVEDQSEQSQQQYEEQEQKLDGQPEQHQPRMQIYEQEQAQQTLRNRSASPDTSSMFDNSAMDTSQENTTMLTEPDAEQAAGTLPLPRPRKLLTREEARQKARILRLKLGLANYKLQTGQENVPLDRLEVKPRPGKQHQEITRERALPRVMVQPPSSRDGPPEKDVEGTREVEQHEPERTEQQTPGQTESEKMALPRMETAETGAAREGQDEEPTSAVCGGIASSLLTLARGSSSVSSSS